MLSDFGAGGKLTLTVPLWLHKRSNADGDKKYIKLVRLVAFFRRQKLYSDQKREKCFESDYSQKPHDLRP